MIDYSEYDSAIGLNWWDIDPNVQTAVDRHCPAQDLEWATTKLAEFGAVTGERIARNADIVDAHPPRLRRYDRWADELNEIEHHPAALDTKAALWNIGYASNFAPDRERRGRRTPAVVKMAVDYLLCQADIGMACSVGQTNGVAKLVDRYAPDDVRDDLLAKLNADDFADGTDGAMFLTERESGSDLGRSVHTSARDIGDGRVLISGEKWFASNVDGDAILLLARPEGAPAGAAGIGLYLVPRIRLDGSPNSIHMRRLKDKLGTRSVPTGEAVLDDALGFALRGRKDSAAQTPDRSAGSDAKGLNRMMEMVNGTRLGVAMMSLGIARRCFVEAAIWAHHRAAKGRLLVDLPLVRQQLVDLLVDLEGGVALGFCPAVVDMRDSEGRALRRAVTSAAKARLSRFGVEAATFAVEIHGGNGYCEDWRLTRQLRDAHCNPIWEGAENICSLDTLRVMRDADTLDAVVTRISDALDAVRGSGYGFAKPAAELVARGRDRLVARLGALDGLGADYAQVASAPLMQTLTSSLAGALLLEESIGDPRKALVATRYAQRHLDSDSASDPTIALEIGRELIAYENIGESRAASITQTALV